MFLRLADCFGFQTKAGEFAMKTARSVASQPGLEEYVTLLEETLANLADDEKVKAHASVCELVVRAASLIASGKCADPTLLTT